MLFFIFILFLFPCGLLILAIIAVEGGGAVALAAARSVIEMDARPTVIIISGANVDNATLVSVLNKEDS